MLQISIGINSDRGFSASTLRDYSQTLQVVSEGYRELYPRVQLRHTLFPEEALPSQLQRRSRAGLGPDLIVTNGSTAALLHQRGLSRSVSLPPALRRQIEPVALQRLSLPDGRLIGLPLTLDPQFACFNRRRLAASPSTLSQLLSPSRPGPRVGLWLDAESLYWSAGAFGADDALLARESGLPVSAAARQRLLDWLDWLQTASRRDNLVAYVSYDSLIEDFLRDRLDWIPCRSLSLPRLRERLGTRLGVAPLPRGPHGAATPLARLRVIAFGTGSTPLQRELADQLGLLTQYPVNQRALIQRSLASLPVNRLVTTSGVEGPLGLAVREARRQMVVGPQQLSLLASASEAAPIFADTMIELVFGQLTVPAAAEALLAAGRQSR